MSKKAVWITVCAAALAAIVFFSATLYLQWRDHRRYPLTYLELIQPYAREYDLDPKLVLAVDKVESGFRPAVVSSAGAVGLMQIMPETGGWISGKLGEEGYEDAWLTDPDHNLAYGCWYLRYLFNRYDGHFEKTLAAYNAGGTNVDKWCGDPEIAPQDGAFIVEKIPFAQTRNYVQKVHHAYAEYERIYKNDGL